MKPLNVLSLFDGMSCGQIALTKLGIPTNYYASEIDKFAIQVTKHNFPKTTHLGDVSSWKKWGIDFSKVDLIIGGSPCQGFSYAGKQLAFKDPRSKLFFTFVEILNFVKEKNPNVKFLLENVKMKKDYLHVISEFLGVEPVCYNSALVSAQRRIRYYWSNLPYPEIEDRGVLVKDILDIKIDKTTIAGKGWQKWFKDNREFQLSKQYSSILGDNDKAITMTARQYASWNNNFVGIKKVNDNKRVKGITEDERGYRPNQGDSRSSGISELGRITKKEGKTDTITTTHSPKIALNSDINNLLYRRLSVKECCRLQTVPDNYFEGSGVSNSQAYKMLGNGWTVDIIVEVLKGLL